MRKLVAGLLFVLVLIVLYYAFIPSPIDAAVYDPPDAPAWIGEIEPNELLEQAERLAIDEVYGPEDVALDARGRIYGGTQDGKIVRILQDGGVETFAETGGRPLGLHFDAQDNLIVADAWKGLLSIDPQGRITTLATQAEGIPFRFTNDLDIATDGVIYFSDASSKFSQPEYMLDGFESKPYGRLLSYQPEKKEVKVLVRDLYFANGVALSANEDFVLVNETWRYRITRFWLKGSKQGSHELFIGNLPGFPDGISSNREGVFWLALPSTRNAFLDKIHPLPWAKNLIVKLPEFLRPKPIDYGLILALDEAGRIVASLHDTDGSRMSEITSVQQYDNTLYFGTLHNRWIGKLELPAEDIFRSVKYGLGAA